MSYSWNEGPTSALKTVSDRPCDSSVMRDELIVSFSQTAWDAAFMCRQQVMLRLARDNDVYYIDPPGSFRDALRRPGRLPGGLSVRTVMPRLHVVKFPAWLGVSYRPWLESLLLGQRIRLLRSLLSRQEYRRPLVYCWHPDYWRYMQYFDRHFVCYHVYDEIAAFDGANEVQVRANDEALARRADVIVAVSEPLANERQRFGRPTYTVYNGADYEEFSRTDWVEPADLAGIPRPRLCLVARQRAHTDFGVLRYLAEHSPYHLIIVGPLCNTPPTLTASAQELLRHPKVHWLGERSREQIPAYVAHSDVCLIPYAITGVTVVAASPLKLFEYLAAGKPVVASEMPPMRRFAPHVRFATTNEDWLREVGAAIASDTDELRTARRALARENSWDAQVQRISSIIARHKSGSDRKDFEAHRAT